ncbi:hypothetical protein F1C58_16525 (plasmid) [Glaciihabitans sp. INWT7]|uniref:hypothetical protein n=1 Tax=Glaciihabitans sp. INWT7 TaxID=2596912 RepID=UPI00162358D7|nr:hypothetical protein [Glaciihabitans sp. INWT7]QNE48662.1 hypothetical protein F1C58_16525 [Glaciihabitans sp. INWT7]
MSATVVLDRDWELFSDWCTAAETSPLPATAETVEAFLRAVPGRPSTARRRLRAIRRAHQDMRVQLPVQLPGRSSTVRSGEEWVSIERALAQIPTLRFPIGLRGRRDAWLLTLIGVLGLTRRESMELIADDIELFPVIRIANRPVPRSDVPAECPACAVTRWLRVVGAASRGHRSEVQGLLNPLGVDDEVHDCGVGLDGSWREADCLTVAVDRRGWIASGKPLSSTSVSAIMKARQLPAGDPLRGFSLAPATGRFKDASSAELASAYDEIDVRLSELLARAEAAVSAGADVLHEIEGHWDPS